MAGINIKLNLQVNGVVGVNGVHVLPIVVQALVIDLETVSVVMNQLVSANLANMKIVM